MRKKLKIKLKKPHKPIPFSVGKHEPLKPCPCCKGKAILSDMLMKSNVTMWQVNCTKCGLSSDLDQDIHFTIAGWNRRLEFETQKMKTTFFMVVMPLIASLFFLAGSYFGLNIFPSLP